MTGGWLVAECVVLSVVAAAVTVVLLWRKGKGELDAALSQVLDMRAEEVERAHVRLIRAHHLNEALESARARQGGAS